MPEYRHHGRDARATSLIPLPADLLVDRARGGDDQAAVVEPDAGRAAVFQPDVGLDDGADQLQQFLGPLVLGLEVLVLVAALVALEQAAAPAPAPAATTPAATTPAATAVLV